MKKKQTFGLPDIGIPAEVLFNFELTDNQKILFGIIRNLSHSAKGCWASNNYLARCINKKTGTITNAISKLKRYGYIIVETEKLDGGGESRHIFIDKTYPQRYSEFIKKIFKGIDDGKVIRPPLKNLIPPSQNFKTKEDTNNNTVEEKPSTSGSTTSKKKSPIEKRNVEFIPLAKTLYDIISLKKNIRFNEKTCLKNWSDEIRRLVESNGVNPSRVKKALRWYKINIGGAYVPLIDSGMSLREKFIKLEDAIEREEGGASVKEHRKPKDEKWMK
ncbi:MAG: helix-turn-helix domain-containing protein [Thermodesulfobacteriota bacterium]